MNAISPFALLDALLADQQPGDTPINLTIGEPRHPAPLHLLSDLETQKAHFNHYPPIGGSVTWRHAVTAWHERRYPTLAGHIDPDQHVLPLAGSREGLTSLALLARQRFMTAQSQGANKTLALVPDPAYRTYEAASRLAGFTVMPLPADTISRSSLPDLSALDPTLLDQTALLFMASPTNPQGDIASLAYLQNAIMLARRHNFILVADECYSELYREAPAPGILAAAFALDGCFTNVVSVNSLSKRSNLPGLRSGFCAGDPTLIKAFRTLRNVIAPTIPLPVQAASATLWGDEEHVEANRCLYQRKYQLVDTLFSGFDGYRSLQGGMFLWFDAGDGCDAASKLWQQGGIRVVPGRYLCLGATQTQPTPGDRFIRIALIDDYHAVSSALKRCICILSNS